MQRCSLNNPDLFGVVDPTSALRLARAKRVIAHFALHTARVETAATGTDTLLENLLEDGLMKMFSMPRGEERQREPVGIFVGPQRGFVHQTTNGKVCHQQA